MNKEVLSEAVRAYVQAGKRGLKLDEAMECAMEIVYADAAKVCKQYGSDMDARNLDPYAQGRVDVSYHLSDMIEERAATEPAAHPIKTE